MRVITPIRRHGAALDSRPGPGRPHGRRIAVLGDMLELGPTGPALHRGLIEARQGRQDRPRSIVVVP